LKKRIATVIRRCCFPVANHLRYSNKVKLNGFDRIASLYDFLAKLVFGKTITESQKYFWIRFPDYSKVLILGGGSGWLLAELLKLSQTVESGTSMHQRKMIALFKKENQQDMLFTYSWNWTRYSFINKIRAVISNFYLDLFTDRQLENSIAKIQLSMNLGAALDCYGLRE